MELRSVYKSIKTKMLLMNETNKRIGQYFLENIKNFEEITLKKIAKETATSEASVTRFCQEIGYEGFIELRKVLIDINKNLIVNNHEFLIQKSAVQSNEIFYETYLDQLDFIQTEIKKLIKSEEFQIASQLLNSFHRLTIAGMNINYNQSIDFKNKMNAIGKNCILETDLHVLNSLANIAQKDDLWITISLSNTNSTIMKFGLIAQKNGAKWIHIQASGKVESPFQPDVELKFKTKENELWNLYSLRGEGLFQLLNVLFASQLGFSGNWKK